MDRGREVLRTRCPRRERPALRPLAKEFEPLEEGLASRSTASCELARFVKMEDDVAQEDTPPDGINGVGGTVFFSARTLATGRELWMLALG